MENLQWFPGHMAKTMRELQDALRLCDLVVEVCDARIPISSRNPDLGRLCQDKPKLLVLNKKDLADPAVTQSWLAKCESALAIDSRQRSQVRQLETSLLHLGQPILEKARSRGRRDRSLRVLICGIPNSGKSTLINALSGRKKARTANEPGVTRSLQWVRINPQLDLLDSPGLLPTKIDNRESQIYLAACAAIKDRLFSAPDLAGLLLLHLFRLYPDQISDLLTGASDLPEIGQDSPESEGLKLLSLCAQQYAFVTNGGELDLERAGTYVLKAFRSGKWGRLSLEWPERA